MTLALEPMILDLADDDYAGLWELVWQAQALMGENAPEDLVALLKPAVERLIHHGKIELFRGIRFSGDEKIVLEPEAGRLLSDPTSWEPPPTWGHVHLRILTVKAADGS